MCPQAWYYFMKVFRNQDQPQPLQWNPAGCRGLNKIHTSVRVKKKKERNGSVLEMNHRLFFSWQQPKKNTNCPTEWPSMLSIFFFRDCRDECIFSSVSELSLLSQSVSLTVTRYTLHSLNYYWEVEGNWFRVYNLGSDGASSQLLFVFRRRTGAINSADAFPEALGLAWFFPPLFAFFVLLGSG